MNTELNIQKKKRKKNPCRKTESLTEKTKIYAADFMKTSSRRGREG
jgi:hypothetical protein